MALSIGLSPGLVWALEARLFLFCFVLGFVWGFFCLFFFFFFGISRATPMAYGGSQVRGRIGAVAAGLHHSHSNSGS